MSARHNAHAVGKPSPADQELQARRLEIESAYQELHAVNQQFDYVRKQVRQQGEFLSTVVDAVSVPIVVLEADSLRVVKANRAFYHGFHAAPATTVGRPLARVEGMAWDSADLNQALLQAADSAVPLTGMELEMRGTREELRTIAASADLAHTAHGYLLVCCLEDVTARKRAQQLLLSRLEMLGATSTALALLDGHQRILYVNPALETMSGYTANELVGGSLHNTLHQLWPGGEPYEPGDCPILAALRQRHAASGEESFRRKDGAYFPVRWQARPLPRGMDGSQGWGAGAVELHDVSRERSMLDSLMASEKQATAGRAAATIAHEINNPLGAIGNALYATQALLQSEPADRARIGVMVATAQRELERISRIVHATLGLYRGGQAPQPVNVNQVCDGILQLLEHRLQEKSVVLRRRLYASRQPALQPGDLRQMLANLVVNAIDAVAPGGCVAVASHDTEDGVRLLVADNGPGIPSAVRACMFEPFLTTKGERGSGLGLWVTAELVRTNRGSLHVKTCTSAPSGTCFGLTFGA